MACKKLLSWLNLQAEPIPAAEYRQRAGALSDAIRTHCLGQYQGTTLVQDGPGIEEYSVHCQVFAVLTGIVEPAEGKQMLETVVGNPEVPQASVAFIFTCSRALERCGWYEKTDDLWEIWQPDGRESPDDLRGE